jgi:hypothetical protein
VAGAQDSVRTVPNLALEPTPTAFARASLRLLARLTASVRLLKLHGMHCLKNVA